MIAAWPTSSIRPPRPPYSSAMSADRSKTGQPWSACQSRFGTHSSAATRPASHGQRGAQLTAAARGRAAHATRIPTSRNATACLLLSPIPATTPASSHSRGRRSSDRLGGQHQHRRPGQGVEVAVESRCPSAMTTAEAATTTAVSTWPPRAAPSSRENCTASSTIPTTASSAGSRSTTRWCGAISVGEPRQERRERRLVRVAPGQPLARPRRSRARRGAARRTAPSRAARRPARPRRRRPRATRTAGARRSREQSVPEPGQQTVVAGRARRAGSRAGRRSVAADGGVRLLEVVLVGRPSPRS